jgi:hypothetical protein
MNTEPEFCARCLQLDEVCKCYAPTEYSDLIDEGVEILRNATGYDWEWWHTGGGCDAFVLNINDKIDTYWLLTCDASIPTNADEWNEITLGLYSEENCEGDIIDEVSTLADLAPYFADRKPWILEHSDTKGKN